MANTKVIKNRINSVRNTQKITNAMYLIASTKLRKAKADLDAVRPFFELFEREIKLIFEKRAGLKSEYFYPVTGRKPAESYAYLVITADKGLAGAYNMNVIKAASEELSIHKKTRLFVVGEYGRQYFNKHHIDIEQSFPYTAQNPTFRRAKDIALRLLAEYEAHRVDEVRIIYSDSNGGGDAKVVIKRLLPFEREDFIGSNKIVSRFKPYEGSARDEYEFIPDASEALSGIIPGYLAGYVYGALIDSFCSEQNARMTAMSSANDNAEGLLSTLQLEYNSVRQAAITQEITEVAAGAKAQKKKRAKEKMKSE